MPGLGPSVLFLFFSIFFFFLMFNMFKHISGLRCKTLSKVVGNMPREETFSLILVHFISNSVEEQPLAFSSALQFFFPLKLELLFDLLEFYKGINMHVDKREHMKKIYLDFLKPLTIFA